MLTHHPGKRRVAGSSGRSAVRFGIVTTACFLLLTVGGTLAQRSTPAAAIYPTNLLCEYLRDPLGMDVPKPRLSWQLRAVDGRTFGQRQTAYQLCVASSERALVQDRGDLWDSGRVKSDESINIVYEGKRLKPETECFWKVRSQDEHGHWSPWSAAAVWTVGPMQPKDWHAKWIGAANALEQLPPGKPTENIQADPWFRKVFQLPATPTKARIYVASVGYHELYVNGAKVSDSVLAPSTTDHSHRARYVTYEITQYLKPGPNVIGLWLGVSWSIFPPYQTDDKPASPIVMAQAAIQFAERAPLEIVTDETWKSHPSPNRLLGFWDAHGFGGECFDARNDLPNWCDLSLDDSNWSAAVIFRPKLVVSADKTEPNRLQEQLSPVSITEVSPTVYRIDMGRNYAGWFEMDLAGQPGDEIRFQFSERPKEAMSFGLHSSYILGPSGQGGFRNRFNYMSGRWVQVSGLKAPPRRESIRGWSIRTDYQRSSSFECDQPRLNALYTTTLWTFENLSLGSYLVDCPQRERRGYGGDGYGSTRTAFDNYRMGAFYTKWLEDWRDVQEPNGFVPHSAPTHLGGGGPAWSGFCVMAPWEMYQRYGDTRILRESFPEIQRWLAFLEAHSADESLVRYGGNWGFLGDWQWPGFWPDRRAVEATHQFLGDTRETLFFNNCYWVLNLDTAAKIAETIGERKSASRYRERADAVRRAVHQHFYNPREHSYVNGFQAYLAIALLADVPPAEFRPLVWRELEREILVTRKGHLWAGITGGACLFNLLLDEGRADLLYTMATQEDAPGWAAMLKRSATTFTEDWEGGGSGLHNSYLYLGSWFIEALAGIRRPAAGYKHFVFEPRLDLPGGPKKVRAHYDSPYGRIATTWVRDERGAFQLELVVPPNTAATVRLNNVEPGSLKAQDGLPMQVGLQGGKIVTVELPAGHYQFRGILAGR